MPPTPAAFVIEQRITAGNDFDGTAPGTDSTTAGGIRKFDAADQGGLFEFDFAPNNCLWVVQRLLLKLDPVGTTFSLKVKNSAGEEVVVASGAGTDIYRGPIDFGGLVLAGDEQLLLTTGSATGVLLARIVARPELQAPPSFG